MVTEQNVAKNIILLSLYYKSEGTPNFIYIEYFEYALRNDVFEIYISMFKKDFYLSLS